MIPSCITAQVPLAPYTTLGVGGNAEFFAVVRTVSELHEVVTWAQREGHTITVLGGGSNVLVKEKGVRGVVVHLVSDSIEYADTQTTTRVTAEAGVSLDAFIAELVARGLWGLENLSHIPGTVGAVPVQNVGAYGIEAKDVIAEVTVYDSLSHTLQTLTNAECRFAYRDSIFKKEGGAHYIITAVTFILSRVPNPQLGYADIATYFGNKSNPSVQEIRDAIIEIRRKKLPDWNTIGTAGSFFKNPIVSNDVFNALKMRYPEMPGYPGHDGSVKVSLGWILDSVCALRGYREGKVGLYEKQALVLVCERGATAEQIDSFVKKVTACVFEKTGLVIEQEVRVLQ